MCIELCAAVISGYHVLSVVILADLISLPILMKLLMNETICRK